MKGAAAMTQSWALVIATIPAERFAPSIAAISPSSAPGPISFRMISCPPTLRVVTRSVPRATRYTSAASSPASSTVCPAS